MLNHEMICDEIEKLEKGSTTYDSCAKLASLLYVRDYYKNKKHMNLSEKLDIKGEEVIKEYSDILPQYKAYCETKRKYQMKETTERAVLDCMTNVCTEIKEFIATLYNNTEMPEERNKISGIIRWLYEQYTE